MTAESTEITSDSSQPTTARGGFWHKWIVRRWLISRGLTLLLLTFEYARVTGDVRYYFRSTGELLGSGAFDDVMREYPPLCVLFTTGLKLVAGVQQDVYAVSFLLIMIGVDIWFTRLLWRSADSRSADSRHGGAGIWVWLWFAPALGPIMYARLDLVPAVLGGAAVVLALRRVRPRPVLAGVLAAFGFVVKLFPLVAMPSLVLRREGRWRLAGAFLATAGVAVGVMYLVLGGERTLSPLTWQQDRGLQIESLFALPLLLASLFRPDTWYGDYTRFLAVEVVGPGVDTLLTAATIGTGVAILILAVLWFRCALVGASVPNAAIGWLFVATVCLMLLTNKVFSPQYLVWLAAALAALGVVADTPAVLRAGRLFVVTCVLTQIFYPTLYHRLFRMQADMIVLITLRDAVLLLLTAVAVRQVWVNARNAPIRQDVLS